MCGRSGCHCFSAAISMEQFKARGAGFMLNFLKMRQAARSWDKTSGPENTDFNWSDIPEIVKSYNTKICGEPIGEDNAPAVG